MRSRAVIFALATAVVLSGGALLPAPAVAGPRFYITVYNRTSNADVTLINAGAEVCWYNQDLEHPLDQNYVTAGTDFRYFTEKTTSSSCTNKGGARGIEFRFRSRASPVGMSRKAHRAATKSLSTRAARRIAGLRSAIG